MSICILTVTDLFKGPFRTGVLNLFRPGLPNHILTGDPQINIVKIADLQAHSASCQFFIIFASPYHFTVIWGTPSKSCGDWGLDPLI